MRYSKLIAMLLVIVVIIPVFYIQSAVKGSEYPEFVFETESGNDEEVKNLTLRANYREGISMDRTHGDQLLIDSDGSNYYGELSYFERLDGGYIDSDIQQLQDEYRSFMRGKMYNPSQFTEDEEKIAYASENSDGQELNIELLDKQSEEETEFTIRIPNTYHRIYVEGVQLRDEKVFVITRNYVYHTGSLSSEEFHVYEIDVINQELNTDQVIAGEAGSPNREVVYRGLVEHANEHSDYIAVQIDTAVSDHNSEMYSEEQMETELYLYNLGSGEGETVELPNDLQESESIQTAVIDESTLYGKRITEDGLEIIAFSLEEKDITNRMMIDLPDTNQLPLNLFHHMEIKDNKMYLVMNPIPPGSILVIDLATEELLYQGTIKFVNPEEERKDYYLNVNDVSL